MREKNSKKKDKKKKKLVSCNRTNHTKTPFSFFVYSWDKKEKNLARLALDVPSTSSSSFRRDYGPCEPAAGGALPLAAASFAIRMISMRSVFCSTSSTVVAA